MPIYQIVRVKLDGNLYREEQRSKGYTELSKWVTTLLSDGWKCQGGITIVGENTTYTELIQAVILE